MNNFTISIDKEGMVVHIFNNGDPIATLYGDVSVEELIQSENEDDELENVVVLGEER